jgi:hypothetical protein
MSPSSLSGMAKKEIQQLKKKNFSPFGNLATNTAINRVQKPKPKDSKLILN